MTVLFTAMSPLGTAQGTQLAHLLAEGINELAVLTIQSNYTGIIQVVYCTMVPDYIVLNTINTNARIIFLARSIHKANITARF